MFWFDHDDTFMRVKEGKFTCMYVQIKVYLEFIEGRLLENKNLR